MTQRYEATRKPMLLDERSPLVTRCCDSQVLDGMKPSFFASRGSVVRSPNLHVVTRQFAFCQPVANIACGVDITPARYRWLSLR
jgi:hypothetical protein